MKEKKTEKNPIKPDCSVPSGVSSKCFIYLGKPDSIFIPLYQTQIGNRKWFSCVLLSKVEIYKVIIPF